MKQSGQTAPWDVLDHITGNDSLNAKKDLIKNEVLKKNTVFFEGCRLAFDPHTMFYVKQVPEKDGADGHGLPWKEFVELTEKLSSRKVTGHEALEEINKAMAKATRQEWNGWYRRILMKDLKARFGVDLLNDAVSGTDYEIELFEAMLAHDSKGKLDKVLTGVKAIEIKYDGVRTLAFYIPGKPIVCYSRNGKVFRNFKKVEGALQDLLRKQKQSLVLDGEMVSATFNRLMTQVNRKTNVQADDSLFVIFDILPMAEFIAGKSSRNYYARRQMLEEVVGNYLEEYPNLTITKPVFIDFQTQMHKYEATKKEVLDAGYEGLIVKDPGAVYECKRSRSWMKVKPFIEVTLTIKDVYEGEPGSEREGLLGGFICEGVEDGKLIKVRVGSGFNATQVKDYWVGRKKLIGVKVEIRADAISENSMTKQADGSYSLRFPRFKCFRGFKKGEKI